MIKKAVFLLIIGMLPFIGMINCSVPFTYTSDKITIELPATNGVYVENTLDFPTDALQSGLSFSNISISYTVRKNGSFAADVSLYASTDQTADNIQESDDEKLIDVTLSLTEDETSGTTVSDKIKEALNNKQPKMIFGAKNLSANPLSSVYIDLQITFTGTYSAF